MHLDNDLIAYEMSCCKRHGRYLSLISIDCKKEDIELKLRDCDPIISDDQDDSVTIILSETDKSGAIVLIERIALEKHFKAAVVTFPFDGFTPHELVTSLQSYPGKSNNLVIF